MTVTHERSPLVPTTTRGTISTLSPGSSAKPKLPTQIRPVPGRVTSSRTTAASDTERHQSTASVNRSGPSVS